MYYTSNFATFYFEIAVKWSKSQIFENNFNRNMCQTPGQMHMHNMVTIDTIVFEIVGGGTFKVTEDIEYFGSICPWQDSNA